MNSGINQRVGWGLILATAIAVIAAMVMQAPAHAGSLPTSPAAVKVSDRKITATCTWAPTSANYSAGTVSGDFSGLVRPAPLSIPRAVVHVAIGCELRLSNFVQVADQFIEADGFYARFSAPTTVSFDRSYRLCVGVAYTLRNGESKSLHKCS